MKNRLQFAITQKDKNLNIWRHIIWFDEAKIKLFGHNDHHYLWRKKGEADRDHVGVFCCKGTSQNRWYHEEKQQNQCFILMIAKLWSQRKFVNRAEKVSNLSQIDQFFQEEWSKIPTKYCDKIVE